MASDEKFFLEGDARRKLPAAAQVLSAALAAFLLAGALLTGCFLFHRIDDQPGPELSGVFPAGVWMQSPEKLVEATGKTYAQTYAEMGITTYLGLWHWPDAVGMYPSYPVAAMQALTDAGLSAWAGSAQDAVDWIAAHPEFSDTLEGYLLGDEPDMKKTSADPAVAAAAVPSAWNQAGRALDAADTERGLYANFGKGFGKPDWAGYRAEEGSTVEEDFALYVEPLEFLSSDFYGITDPWEPPENHGVWTYGRAVAHSISHAGGRPVWGFMEVSAPWSAENYSREGATHLMVHMDAALVRPIVWTMVISGARGIAYFCHDFSGSGYGSAGCFREPGMVDAMTAANESLRTWAGPLLSGTPLDSPVVEAAAGGIAPLALAREFLGRTYVFAIGSGDGTRIHGETTSSTFRPSGAADGRVTVMEEGRELSLKDGAFTDGFAPYELHIYRF